MAHGNWFRSLARRWTNTRDNLLPTREVRHDGSRTRRMDRKAVMFTFKVSPKGNPRPAQSGRSLFPAGSNLGGGGMARNFTTEIVAESWRCLSTSLVRSFAPVHQLHCLRRVQAPIMLLPATVRASCS